MKISICVTIAAALALSCATSAIGEGNTAFIQQPDGNVEIIPSTVIGHENWANRINDKGEVVGREWDTNHEETAFYWNSTSGTTLLGSLGGSYSYAAAINNNGQVAGSSTNASGNQHAFIWDSDGGMRDLGTWWVFPTSVATGINDNGCVVGNLKYTGHANDVSFLWEQGSGINTLAKPSNTGNTAVIAINNSRQIVGTAQAFVDGISVQRAAIWNKVTECTLLGSLGGSYDDSIAVDINDLGQVIGRSEVGSNNWHMFIWDKTNGMRDLTSLGGPNTWVTAINNQGQVLGKNTFSNGRTLPVIWDATHGMSIVDIPFGATDFNNFGQIVGSAYVGGSIPLPEPSCFSTLLAALPGLFLIKRRRLT
ncbi:MAG: hypothetical protein M1133_15870 [Armatimonadetes bacterium]|nr:hypothetical protein [Armatimonadota bacterium]